MKEKITFEGFSKMCRKINNGENLPEEFLKNCFESVSKAEIKVLTFRDMSYEEFVNKGIIKKEF